MSRFVRKAGGGKRFHLRKERSSIVAFKLFGHGKKGFPIFLSWSLNDPFFPSNKVYEGKMMVKVCTSDHLLTIRVHLVSWRNYVSCYGQSTLQAVLEKIIVKIWCLSLLVNDREHLVSYKINIFKYCTTVYIPNASLSSMAYVKELPQRSQ